MRKEFHLKTRSLGIGDLVLILSDLDTKDYLLGIVCGSDYKEDKVDIYWLYESRITTYYALTVEQWNRDAKAEFKRYYKNKS